MFTDEYAIERRRKAGVCWVIDAPLIQRIGSIEELAERHGSQALKLVLCASSERGQLVESACG